MCPFSQSKASIFHVSRSEKRIQKKDKNQPFSFFSSKRHFCIHSSFPPDSILYLLCMSASSSDICGTFQRDDHSPAGSKIAAVDSPRVSSTESKDWMQNFPEIKRWKFTNFRERPSRVDLHDSRPRARLICPAATILGKSRPSARKRQLWFVLTFNPNWRFKL